MSTIHAEECEKAGVNVIDVENITRRMEKLLRTADKMGIKVFGGAGNMSLRFRDKPEEIGGQLILSSISAPNVDGGDGGNGMADDGYWRGE